MKTIDRQQWRCVTGIVTIIVHNLHHSATPAVAASSISAQNRVIWQKMHHSLIILTAIFHFFDNSGVMSWRDSSLHSCCRAWTIVTPYLPDSQRRHWRRYSGYCTPPLGSSWTSDHATMCLPLCETCTGCRSSTGLSLSCACSSTRHSSVIHQST